MGCCAWRVLQLALALLICQGTMAALALAWGYHDLHCHLKGECHPEAGYVPLTDPPVGWYKTNLPVV